MSALPSRVSAPARPSAPEPSHAGRDAASSSWLVFAPRSRFADLEPIGPRTERVTSGPAFVRRLREERPPVAILVAPPAGSAELLAAVTERRQRTGLRIVLLTASPAVDQRLDALALGFDDALPVSIEPAELVGRIRLMLGGTRAALAAPRRSSIAPGIEIDLAARRVIRNGAEVHLRPKEFALLALLASDIGRVFTRDELVDHVWGARYRGSTRTVDVHVRWLRAKLETNPARPRYVITVRGSGYRLDGLAD